MDPLAVSAGDGSESRRAKRPRTASVKVRAVKRSSELRVNVNPNKKRGYWIFTLKRAKSDGSWKKLNRKYRTKGYQETRTVNPPKGTYRVVVRAKFGYEREVSGRVRLRR